MGRVLHRISLRLRLTLVVAVCVALVQSIIGLLVVLYLQSSMGDFINDRYQRRWNEGRRELVALQSTPTNAQLVDIAKNIGRFIEQQDHVVLVYSVDGELLANADALPPPPDVHAKVRGALQFRTLPAAFTATGNTPREGESDQLRVLIGTVQLPTGPVVLVTGFSDTLFQMVTQTVLKAVVIAILFGTLTSGMGGWMLIGRVLIPLAQLGNAIYDLRPDRMNAPRELRLQLPELSSIADELVRTRQDIQRAFGAQERFIANVSHEVKTPIAVLLAETQALSGADLSPDAERFVRSVREEMQRLGRLVDSFLLLSKVQAGKAQPVERRVSVNDFVLEAVEHCGGMARQHSVSLLPHLDPNAQQDLVVTGDASLLQTMVDNLIRNAIRFAPRDTRVDITVSQTISRVEIAVRDRGPGIPPEMKAKLFQRFAQADSERQRGRGTGLGLLISQGIAELHGGTIAHAEPAGGGCTFLISLPLAGRPVMPGPGGLAQATP